MKKDKVIKIPEYIKHNLDKYKYVLMICALGLILALWPSGDKAKAQSAEPMAAEAPLYGDAELLSQSLSEAFSAIEGVGQVKVLLTVKTGYESVFAYDQTQAVNGGETQKNTNTQTQLVTVSGGGEESPVVRKINYPVFMGAVVICQGGDSPKIKLELTQAVKSLTGISSENIVITKMQS